MIKGCYSERGPCSMATENGDGVGDHSVEKELIIEVRICIRNPLEKGKSR